MAKHSEYVPPGPPGPPTYQRVTRQMRRMRERFEFKRRPGGPWRSLPDPQGKRARTSCRVIATRSRLKAITQRPGNAVIDRSPRHAWQQGGAAIGAIEIERAREDAILTRAGQTLRD